MRSSLLRRSVLAAALAAALSAAPQAADRKLEIEWVDVLGGAATLEQPFADPSYVVSPCAYVLGLLGYAVGALAMTLAQSITGRVSRDNITDIVTDWKASGKPGGRHELLLRLARTGGVYVPAFYAVSYLADGRINCNFTHSNSLQVYATEHAVFPGEPLHEPLHVHGTATGLPVTIPTGGRTALDLTLEAELPHPPGADTAPPMRWSDGKQEELRLVLAVSHDREPGEHAAIANHDDVGVAVVDGAPHALRGP